jgi:hypothetical protein
MSQQKKKKREEVKGEDEGYGRRLDKNREDRFSQDYSNLSREVKLKLEQEI